MVITNSCEDKTDDGSLENKIRHLVTFIDKGRAVVVQAYDDNSDQKWRVDGMLRNQERCDAYFTRGKSN